MAGFKKVEDKKARDEKRRGELNEEDSSIKPEVIRKADFYAKKKRGDYIADNVEETRNVQ